MKKISSFLLSILLSISYQATAANQGMVVTEFGLASKVGADILRKGGNAIDAAVAIGYALAVVNPCCGNIGGGGFMTIHLASGQNIFINFREKAPLHSHKDMYIDEHGNVMLQKSLTGYLAVGVPGTVLGLDTALQEYGTMKREEVMAPAIRIANEGFKVSPFLADQMKPLLADFKKNKNVASIFLKNGKTYKAGDILVQKELANTLSQIARSGPDYFYKGPIAKEIVAASQQHGGILTMDDFANYHVEMLTPIYCNYRGYQIISAPPPSSGGTILCEMLNILENFPLKKMGRNSFDTARVIVESMRYGFIDRNTKMGDPNFVHNPLDLLLSKDYAKKISLEIKKSPRAPKIHAPTHHPEMTDTTHYSVVDSYGNAVAVTYTLNDFFGALVMAGDTGFFLNNEMNDFAIDPRVTNKFGLLQTNINEIQPAKRPLSSMAPTIIMRNGKLVMVLGGPGGPRIITSLLLTILNVIDFNLPFKDAVNTPRFHYQAYPDVIDAEPFSVSFARRHQFELFGYHVLPQPTFGAIEAILIKDNGKLEGGSDIRRPDGLAISVDMTN